MVVCGAGLTLVHCGGRSTGDRGDRDDGNADDTSGTSQGSAAGNGGAGTSTAQGGASAGALSLAGAMNVPAGGSSAGAPSDPKRPAGPTEQWGCDGSAIRCTGERFDIDYRDCARDETRPTLPEDCPAGTSLACLRGYLDDEPVLFNCACRSPLAGSCACPEVLDNCSARVRAPERCEMTSECGCAITCILR